MTITANLISLIHIDNSSWSWNSVYVERISNKTFRHWQKHDFSNSHKHSKLISHPIFNLSNSRKPNAKHNDRPFWKPPSPWQSSTHTNERVLRSKRVKTRPSTPTKTTPEPLTLQPTIPRRAREPFAPPHSSWSRRQINGTRARPHLPAHYSRWMHKICKCWRVFFSPALSRRPLAAAGRRFAPLGGRRRHGRHGAAFGLRWWCLRPGRFDDFGCVCVFASCRYKAVRFARLDFVSVHFFSKCIVEFVEWFCVIRFCFVYDLKYYWSITRAMHCYSGQNNVLFIILLVEILKYFLFQNNMWNIFIFIYFNLISILALKIFSDMIIL